MPLDESEARRTLRRNLATNVSKKFTRFRRNDVLQRIAKLSPAPALRPPAGGAAEEDWGLPSQRRQL